MILLQLTANELTVLNEVLHSDMDLSSYEAPNLSADEREFVMTGIPPYEWYNMFEEEEISTCLNTR